METHKIKVKIENNELTIKISTDWLVQECANSDWQESHSTANLNNEFDAIEWLEKKLLEPCIDLGNGYVTPVENMIMDLLQKAIEDGEYFFDENE